MTRVLRVGWMAVALAAGVVWLTGSPGAVPTAELVGGLTKFGTMLGCGVCFGGGLLLMMEGSVAMFLFMARQTSFGIIGACAGVCATAVGL